MTLGEDPTRAADIKKRTRDHWTSVPIGTQTDGFRSNHEPFTKGYFEDHARFRYDTYSPWLRSVARFDQYAGKRLLEVGCGMGTDLLEYARGGAEVVGYDLTLHHLELAQRRFELFGQTSDLVNGDAESLAFADSTFDAVFSNGVLHHTPDTQQSIDEIFRVLKPGGEALIILYHRHSVQYYFTILFKSGTRRFLGRLIKGRNPFQLRRAQILSASTDGETNPLTKVYSRKEGRNLMTRFENIRTEVYHLNRSDIFLGTFLPESLLNRLSRKVGWYLVLRGTKPQ